MAVHKAAGWTIIGCLLWCAATPRGVHGECRSDEGVVRSSNAAGNGYDNWAGHGDPFACAWGWAPVKTGETSEYEGKMYEEYYCCTAKCDDQRCTSPDGTGGDDCSVVLEEATTCSNGAMPVRETPHFKPEGEIFGIPVYKYTCCEWPDGKEPEVSDGIGVLIGIIIGAIVGLAALVGGIVACVCCCMQNQRQTIVVQTPMQPMLPTNAQATAVPVANMPAEVRFCEQCGAQVSGAFCGGCGKTVNSAA